MTSSPAPQDDGSTETVDPTGGTAPAESEASGPSPDADSPDNPHGLDGPDTDSTDSTDSTDGRGPGGRDGRDGIVDLEKEGEIAADYLEDLLDIVDLDGDIDMDVERDRAIVSVVGGDLDDLVGRHGNVLEALQELTRLAVHAQTGNRSRLMLDVAGYRAGRKAVLTELGRQTAETVRATGEKVRLEPMSPFERKVVHDAVAEAGLTSESEGEEPQRRVVVLPL